MSQDLISYYREIAKEYDKFYSIPGEQHDLLKATEIFQKLFLKRHVLGIACGTGYWTEQIATSAASVWATDVNESVIEIARSRSIARNVVFEVADMYSLALAAEYDALFGGFIWSHVLLGDLVDFLYKIAGFLKPKATVAFIDSKQVDGSSHSRESITRTDEQGNTYQPRSLENGTNHLVLKIFPSQEFLVQKLTKFSQNVNYIDLEHYWIVCFELNQGK